MMKNAIIFDLDGTLCSSKDRLHLVTGDVKNYDLFHKIGTISTQISKVTQLARVLQKNYAILILTGRDDSFVNETMTWLKNYDIEYDILKMRKHGDYRPAHIIKQVWLQELSTSFTIRLAFDDDLKCLNMYKQNGITVVEVRE